MIIGKQFIDLKKMANKMYCYVYEGGELVHNANEVVLYKGGRVITLYVNVQISHVELVSTICRKLNVDPNSVKMHHTCKFDPLMMVLLNNDGERAKMFRFNDSCNRVFVSSNSKLPAVDVIPFTRYSQFN